MKYLPEKTFHADRHKVKKKFLTYCSKPPLNHHPYAPPLQWGNENGRKKVFKKIGFYRGIRWMTSTVIFLISLISLLIEANGNEREMPIMKDITYCVKNSNFEKGAISSKGTIDGWDNIGARGLPVAD